MMKLLKVGDRVFFDDDEHLVVALSGVRVRLEAADGAASVVLVSHLVDSPGFAILGQSDADRPRAMTRVVDRLPMDGFGIVRRVHRPEGGHRRVHQRCRGQRQGPSPWRAGSRSPALGHVVRDRIPRRILAGQQSGKRSS